MKEIEEAEDVEVMIPGGLMDLSYYLIETIIENVNTIIGGGINFDNITQLKRKRVYYLFDILQ